MDKSTDINDLPFKKQGPGGPPTNLGGPGGPGMGQAPPNPINTSPDGVQPAARFAQMPDEQRPMHGGQGMPQLPPGMIRSGMEPKIGGAGQGISSPEKPVSGKKEFFGLKETDYKSTVVVFALLLIFSSSFFFEMLRTYLPSVMEDGKTTLIGSLIAALMGSIIYIIIKCTANLG